MPLGSASSSGSSGFKASGVSVVCFQRENSVNISRIECLVYATESNYYGNTSSYVIKKFPLQLKPNKSGDGATQLKTYEASFSNVNTFVNETAPVQFRIFTTDNVQGYATPQLIDSRFSEDLSSLLNNQVLSNVQFKVDEQLIPAHRAVIAARSSVLAALIKEHFAKEEKSRGSINITSMQPKMFRALLQFIYTGNVFTYNRHLGAVAEEYKVLTLTSLCKAASKGSSNFEELLKSALLE